MHHVTEAADDATLVSTGCACWISPPYLSHHDPEIRASRFACSFSSASMDVRPRRHDRRMFHDTIQRSSIPQCAWLSRLLSNSTPLTPVRVGVSLSVDSYFWRDAVWPELQNLFFNVIEGHSAKWGVSGLDLIYPELR